MRRRGKLKNRYNVIVIGAGPGGTCCAALLAKKGAKVLLLDKNPRVGGKTMNVSTKWIEGEMWPIGGIPTTKGSWLAAFRALGIEFKLDVVVKPGGGVMRY
jgi:phytoene dehydrogenase-like protein